MLAGEFGLMEVVRVWGGEVVGKGGETFGSQMGDSFVLLDNTFNPKEGFLRDEQACCFVKTRGDDDVGDAGFVFETEENKPLGRSGALAADDHSGGLEAAAMGG